MMHEKLVKAWIQDGIQNNDPEAMLYDALERFAVDRLDGDTNRIEHCTNNSFDYITKMLEASELNDETKEEVLRKIVNYTNSYLNLSDEKSDEKDAIIAESYHDFVIFVMFISTLIHS
jgi:hypothetical protein